MTQIVPAQQPQAIARAAAILREGGLVAFPTETVYGLGADAASADAVARIFAAKGRPADHPVIAHLCDARELDRYARVVPPAARVLAAAFWPGPLTLILERHDGVPDAVTGGLPTVGLRVPAHPVALALLTEFGGAIAAPSANRFGQVSPTTAAHVRESLGDRVDLILDGGACRVGVESTIVDLSSGAPRVLRPGGVTVDQLARALGQPVAVASGAPVPAETVRAPGTLPSHYAPRARVELVGREQVLARLAALRALGLRVGVLTAFMPKELPDDVPRIPLPEDAEAAAARLYQALHEVDAQNLDVVLVAPPREEGLGLAVADRLRRAAGPRP